ncbi:MULTISPECIES: hypothetical protein [Actinomycetes]|uniref:Uncharacterized protein n=1 Tax=Streptomyces noursei TaxID=1971 RepID=A0A2N8P409_STRNR|nr:hypothetical protein [Streptomyces noursei]PNE35765.1 hypothetical protein AOB60_43025 [Streptomyces noursei]
MTSDHLRHQEHLAPGAETVVETWGDPSGSSRTTQIGSHPGNPPGNAGPERRRRLDINVDGHFELALYVSPRLLRWFGGLCLTAASGTWYLLTHMH